MIGTPGTNFLPHELRAARRSAIRVRRVIAAAAGYLTCLLLATLTLVLTTPSLPAAGSAALLQSDLDRTAEALQYSRRQLIEAERELVSVRRLTQRADLSLLLPIIAQQVKVDGTLHDLRIEPVSAEKPQTLVIGLRGVTASYAGASGLALRLEQLKLFKTVQLQKTDRQLGAGGEEVSFDIRCTLDGGAL